MKHRSIIALPMILDMERIRMLIPNSWSVTFILFNYQSQP